MTAIDNKRCSERDVTVPGCKEQASTAVYGSTTPHPTRYPNHRFNMDGPVGSYPPDRDLAVRAFMALGGSHVLMASPAPGLPGAGPVAHK